MCYDIVFKDVFTGEENILAKMVSDITDMDYGLLKDNVILEVNELPISTKNKKTKRCDFILRILDNKNINLEVNSWKYNGLIIKNSSYLSGIFASSNKRGDKYNEDMFVMQINLNCYHNNNVEEVLSHYQLQEVSSHKLFTKNISIFDLNVEKCHELYFNLGNQEDIPNYVKWGVLLYCEDFKKIPDIVKGIILNKERDKIMSKLDKLTRDDLFMTEVETLEWSEWERKSIEEEARNKGLTEGRVKGQEEERAESTKEIILSMIENKLSLDIISKITNKTIAEIKK